MTSYYQVFKGICQDDVHVDVLHPLTVEDFEFTDKVKTCADQGFTGSQAWVTVSGKMKPGVLAEVVATFQVGRGRHFNRYHEENSENLARNCFNTDRSMKVDLRGCRTEVSKKAKIVKELERLAVALKDCVPELRQSIVDRVNGLIQHNIDECNRRCHENNVRTLCNKWPDLDEEAGLTTKEMRLEELRAECRQMSKELLEARNAHALKDMESHDWKVRVDGQEVVLDTTTIADIKDRYQRNEAFRSGTRFEFGG